jgi:hypothetical protein
MKTKYTIEQNLERIANALEEIANSGVQLPLQFAPVGGQTKEPANGSEVTAEEPKTVSEPPTEKPKANPKKETPKAETLAKDVTAEDLRTVATYMIKRPDSEGGSLKPQFQAVLAEFKTESITKFDGDKAAMLKRLEEEAGKTLADLQG